MFSLMETRDGDTVLCVTTDELLSRHRTVVCFYSHTHTKTKESVLWKSSIKETDGKIILFLAVIASMNFSTHPSTGASSHLVPVYFPEKKAQEFQGCMKGFIFMLTGLI